MLSPSRWRARGTYSQGRRPCHSDEPRWCTCARPKSKSFSPLMPFFSDAPQQIEKVISNLSEQYKTKETDFENFKRDYNIRPAAIA